MSTRRITGVVPNELLNRAQRVTGEGIAETVRRGLELLVATDTVDDLRRLRGKVQLNLGLAALRRDRR